MSQLSLSLDSSLLVRDAQGCYLLASADQILAAVGALCRVQPGHTLDSAPPSTSRILPVTQPEAGVAR
jgi:DNA repair protein RadC